MKLFNEVIQEKCLLHAPAVIPQLVLAVTEALHVDPARHAMGLNTQGLDAVIDAAKADSQFIGQRVLPENLLLV